MKLDYFYSLTPRQFDNVLTGYRNKEETKEKLVWERSRYNWWYTVIAQNGSKDFPLNSFHPFPWETINQSSLETKKPKTRAQLKAEWDEMDKKA